MMNHTRRSQRPVTKESISVNVLLWHQAPDTRIAGVVPVVTHHEIVVRPHVDGGCATVRQIESWIEIRLIQVATVNSYHSFMDLHCVAGETDDPLDVTLGRIVWKPKDYDVATIQV